MKYINGFYRRNVLWYLDLEVTKKIKDEKINSDDFKILRYRDDYRIFVNDPNIGEKIIKILTIILSDVWMRINQEKTKGSDDIIYSSIKEDKLYLMQEYKYQKNIQKELLNMLIFSRKYNNSKQLNKMLQELFYKVEKRNKTYQNINVITAILADLAYHNPESYPIIASLLSKFLSFLPNNDEIIKIIEKIRNKFSKIPNTEHFNIRLQRIELWYNIENNYEWILCKKVIDNSIKIWSTNRLNWSLKTIIDTTSIIDKNEIKNLTKTVSKDEVEQFWKKKQYNY